MTSVRRRRRPNPEIVKDRLIQARIPERLDSVLKEAAQKQRLSVSHLIRNILEDTLDLVDTVVTGAEGLVGGSVEFAEQVKRDAGRIANSAREVVRTREDATPEPRNTREATWRAPSGVATEYVAPPSDVETDADDEAPPSSGDEIEPESGNYVSHSDHVEAPLATTVAQPVTPRADKQRRAALESVLAWNRVVVNKPATCASCFKSLPRGSGAHLGINQDPTAPPAWLCEDCLAKL
jgi:hypothetical protein